MKAITKKQVKELFEAKKLTRLMNYIITDGTKTDTINALYLLMSKGGDEYDITFESVPYSRGGKYKRHTSTLCSAQKWEVIEGDNGYYISRSSTSRSANCPSVIVPIFYTETGRQYYNSIINNKIEVLRAQLI